MAIQFVEENDFLLTKTKMSKLKGLVQTLSGTRICSEERRIGIIVNYLKHQTEKRTIREEEKAFYENLIRIINSEDGLRKFLNISEFSDCLIQDNDGRKDKATKRDKQNFYMYFIAKDFMNHVIAEKMKGL